MMAYWKCAAVSRLGEYAAMRKAARSLPQQIKKCVSRSPIDSDVRLDAMAKRTELEQRYHYVKRWTEHMDKALALLTPEERLVVELLYITPDKGHLGRLCMHLDCEQATVYRKRDKALQKITLALYGRK